MSKATQQPRCTAKTRSGGDCPNRPLAGKRFCWVHDASTQEARREGQRRGGLNRRRQAVTLPEDAPPLALKTPADVAEALASVMNDLRTGKVGTNVASVFGMLSGYLLKALDASDLSARIADIERKLGVK